MKLEDVIIRHLYTEKVLNLSESVRTVAFEVDRRANKHLVKNAVEKMFPGVKVEKVRILNVNGKKRRRGFIVGKTRNWKKAYVKLAPDSNNKALKDFFDALE